MSEPAKPEVTTIRPPIDRVCLRCGAKHTTGGPLCDFCRSEDSREARALMWGRW